MNEFVRDLYNRDKCEYENFLTYCQSRGLCTMEDGKTMTIDEETYRKALKDYMKEFKINLEAEKNIEEFKGGIRR